MSELWLWWPMVTYFIGLAVGYFMWGKNEATMSEFGAAIRDLKISIVEIKHDAPGVVPDLQAAIALLESWPEREQQLKALVEAAEAVTEDYEVGSNRARFDLMADILKALAAIKGEK